MQIVCNGTSSRLRKRALRDATYSLENMLIYGRKAETSTAQATGIEAQQQPHEVRRIHQQRVNKIKHAIFVVWHTHMEINLAQLKILFAIPVESVDIFKIVPIRYSPHTTATRQRKTSAFASTKIVRQIKI